MPAAWLLHRVHLSTRGPRGRASWPGALIGITLHFLANLPIYLASIGFLGINPATWKNIAVFLTIGLAAVLLAAVYRLARDKRRVG